MVVLSEVNLPYIKEETEWMKIDDGMWTKEYTYSDGKIAKASTNVDPHGIGISLKVNNILKSIGNPELKSGDWITLVCDNYTCK